MSFYIPCSILVQLWPTSLNVCPCLIYNILYIVHCIEYIILYYAIMYYPQQTQILCHSRAAGTTVLKPAVRMTGN